MRSLTAKARLHNACRRRAHNVHRAAVSEQAHKWIKTTDRTSLIKKIKDMVYQQAINKAWLNRYAELYKDDGFEVEWENEQRFVASKVFNGKTIYNITVYNK